MGQTCSDPQMSGYNAQMPNQANLSDEMKRKSLSKKQSIQESNGKGNSYIDQTTQSQSKGPPTNERQYQRSLDHAYKVFLHQYKEHYIDKAHQRIVECQKLISQMKFKKYKYTFTDKQSEMLEKVKVQYNDMINYEKQIERQGWIESSNKNGIKILTRRQTDGTVGVKIQALTDVPFQVLISVLLETQYYKDYTPFLQISRLEKTIARNIRIGYSLSNIPFVTKRQAYFQGVGYSRLQHPSKELFLFTRSIHDKPLLQKQLQYEANPNPQYIQLDYKYFVVRYRPIKKDTGMIDMSMNVDSKMNFVPTWLMEKISKDFGQKFFKNVVRISKNFKGSKWQKSVQNNPQTFLYFKKQVKNYLAQNTTTI